MTVGLGAVATTMIAGVEAVRRKLGLPIGSMTKWNHSARQTHRQARPKIKDFVPLASLDDLVFASWDLFTDNAYEAALKAGVLDSRLVEQLKDFLVTIKPMPAAFEQTWVKRLHPNNLKTGATKMDLAEQIMEDIRQFKKTSGAARLVMIWCGSTELYTQPHPVHDTLESFEEDCATTPPISPQHALCLRRAEDGRPVRQWRAAYDNGLPGPHEPRH